MPTTLKSPPEARTLEEELQSLELEENELENRATSLELKTILIAMLAGAALIFSVVALTVALVRSTGNGTGSNMAATMATHGGTAAGSQAATPAAPSAALPVKDVKLTLKGGAKPGPKGQSYDAFLPTTDLRVRAGQTVRVTVYNYDDMPHSFTSPALAKGAAIPAGEQQTQGTAQDLKVMPMPGIGIDQLILPGSDRRPSKTTFTFTAPGKAGTYIWYCKIPCDAWAMAHLGYMRGRVIVTSA